VQINNHRKNRFGSKVGPKLYTLACRLSRISDMSGLPTPGEGVRTV